MKRKRGKPKPIPLSDEMAELLKAQQARFREKFGRYPGPDDPLLFDPEADEPRPMDPAKVEGMMVQAMEQAGIDPAKIYAFRRTGRLISEENARFLSKRDLAEWQAAIEEYEQRAPRN